MHHVYSHTTYVINCGKCPCDEVRFGYPNRRNTCRYESEIWSEINSSVLWSHVVGWVVHDFSRCVHLHLQQWRRVWLLDLEDKFIRSFETSEVTERTTLSYPTRHGLTETMLRECQMSRVKMFITNCTREWIVWTNLYLYKLYLNT